MNLNLDLNKPFRAAGRATCQTCGGMIDIDEVIVRTSYVGDSLSGGHFTYAHYEHKTPVTKARRKSAAAMGLIR